MQMQDLRYVWRMLADTFNGAKSRVEYLYTDKIRALWYKSWHSSAIYFSSACRIRLPKAGWALMAFLGCYANPRLLRILRLRLKLMGLQTRRNFTYSNCNSVGRTRFVHLQLLKDRRTIWDFGAMRRMWDFSLYEYEAIVLCDMCSGMMLFLFLYHSMSSNTQ